MTRRFFKRYKKFEENDESDSSNINNNNKENIQKSENSEMKKPGFKDMANNLTRSLIEWQKSGRPVVTSEQWNKRLTICRGCQYWSEIKSTQIARCLKCGCSSGKLLLSTSKCPLNPPKWGSEV